MRNFNKIFQIGLCKSGTWTLHQTFTDLGLISTHDDKIVNNFIANNDIEGLKNFIKDYQAINSFNYKNFEKYFPDSLYIFSYRNPYDMAYSMAKHCYNRPEKAKEDPLAFESDKLYQYGWTDFNKNVKRIEDYYTEVFNYFYPLRNSFLFVDIFNSPEKSYKNICNFLNIETDKKTFSHLNENIY